MRAFYQQILDQFHIYCGFRSQQDTTKWSDEDVKKLLDVLCKVSEVYNYIPEADQQRIIEAQLIKDQDYTTLNARTVSRWLELNGKQYFKEVAHEPIREFEPATEEQKDFWMNEWKKALANVDTQFTQATKGNGQRMKEQLETAGIVHDPTPRETSALEDEVGVICEVCKTNPCICK